VLSQYFDEVTIVERDTLPLTAEPRKGVPQGRHVHVIFGGGVDVIDRLYPDFLDELVAAGSVVCDFAKDLRWYHQGVWKLRTESQLTSYWQSRPFLESHIRQQTRNVSNVRIVERCDISQLLSSADKTRITGVVLQARTDQNNEETLAADLVVDASGRGSRTPGWLASLGYSTPEETSVEVNIGYASRTYQRVQDTTRDWQILATYGTPPHGTRTGYLFPIENNRWLATAVGHLSDYPPDDEQGFLDYIRSLEMPDMYDTIKDARPLTDVATFKFPTYRWQRYDRLHRFPAGLLVLGDAVCSFNPVYGQGMSACALQVDLLDRLLQTSDEFGRTPSRFAKSFFQQGAKIIANPWLLATNSDFLYPRTRGHRPFTTKLLNAYLVRVCKLCAWNKPVLLRFYRVMHFMDPPATLFDPYVVFQVIRSAFGFSKRTHGRADRRSPPHPIRIG
jgi:2-polyprenyl-6-methoxyphenol hydroxylase-like FAD-dependent oxidoreductase